MLNIKQKQFYRKIALSFCAVLAANVTFAATGTTLDVDDNPDAITSVQDPYEGFNRAMFAFNDKVDIFILKPVATVYDTIMPRPLNQGVHNFFTNLAVLPTLANDLLQVNFYQAANDFWRFAINTTVGIGGLFDVASRIGLKNYTNDFGLTLTNWGWRKSNYLVLPFLGPNTFRDGGGVFVDYYGFSVYPRIRPQSLGYGIYGLGVIDRRAQLLKFQSIMEEAALDKYIFVRNAYMQRRAYQVEENAHLSYWDQVKKNDDNVVAAETTDEAAGATTNAVPNVTNTTVVGVGNAASEVAAVHAASGSDEDKSTQKTTKKTPGQVGN